MRRITGISLVAAMALAAIWRCAAPAFADVITLSEVDAQPQLLHFTATPGTVVLCDTTGVNSSTPRNVPALGGWGCYSGLVSAPKLVEASDLITFAANPNMNDNKMFPSIATFCSDVDPLADKGDADKACKAAVLKVTAGFALQELGTEGKGPEETAFNPAVGQPGYSKFMEGTREVVISYNLISDPAANAPEPPTFALAIGALGAWCGVASRRRARR